MTEKTYEDATMLKNQIHSVDRLLETLRRFPCECDPPTRMSGYRLVVNHSDTKIDIELNQGEVAYIRYFLESYKTELQHEFAKL